MNYTDEEKKILRRSRFDGFANGYRKGCCFSIFICGMAVFSLSFCSNKPINYQIPCDKQPSLVKKGTPIVKTTNNQNTKE